jgi:site-specific DNA-methyltransferase (adenine-specific)
MSVDLRLGDCLELMRDISDASVDAVITDPPYGIGYQSAWRIDSTQWKPKIENDKEPFIHWIEPGFRILQDSGVVICFTRWDVEETFKRELRRVGFDIRSQIIWDRVVHGMGDLNAQFAPQHDNILFAIKGNFRFWGKRPSTVIRTKRIDPEKLVHPNEKPIVLMYHLCESVVKPGGIIVDPFMGSGTTGVACVRLNRNFIGIEILPEYFKIAQRRIAEAQAQMTMEL